MHKLVMITKNDDGEVVPLDERKWCLCVDKMGSPMALCTVEVFGYGEGDAVGQTKTVTRGGITCPQCREEIKAIKALRL